MDTSQTFASTRPCGCHVGPLALIAFKENMNKVPMSQRKDIGRLSTLFGFTEYGYKYITVCWALQRLTGWGKCTADWARLRCKIWNRSLRYPFDSNFSMKIRLDNRVPQDDTTIEICCAHKIPQNQQPTNFNNFYVYLGVEVWTACDDFMFQWKNTPAVLLRAFCIMRLQLISTKCIVLKLYSVDGIIVGDICSAERG